MTTYLNGNEIYVLPRLIFLGCLTVNINYNTDKIFANSFSVNVSKKSRRPKFNIMFDYYQFLQCLIRVHFYFGFEFTLFVFVRNNCLYSAGITLVMDREKRTTG